MGGLPPGQQLVTTEDGQQVLISEDGTQQVISGAATGLTNTLTEDGAEGEAHQQILVMPDGQQMIAAPGNNMHLYSACMNNYAKLNSDVIESGVHHQ